jgi:hypothetical protein
MTWLLKRLICLAWRHRWTFACYGWTRDSMVRHGQCARCGKQSWARVAATRPKGER